MSLPNVETFERAGLLAWPGLEVEWDGNWVLRAANGYTKRANSLQCFDPNDDADIERRLLSACRWFETRNLPPVIRMSPLDSPALNAELDAQGWQAFDHSHLFAMALGVHEADAETQTYAPLYPAFLEAQQALQAYDPDTLSKLKALLGALSVPAAGIVVYRNNQPVASGLMAIGNDIVVTGNVVTHPEYRRQGLAAAMMHTGLAWARTQGAHTAALNVAADNRAAQSLYRSLGYTHQYDYAYRVQGQGK